MPHHPNIMSAPKTLVAIWKPGDEAALVCGILYPFLPNGTVASEIENYNERDERILLSNKARWCYQMTAAVAHTVLMAHTYHMDIKPGNFLLDENANLILIDWEQSDAPVTTAAPEIDGTWDVRLSSDGSGTLVYTKYTGPQRRNMPTTTPGSNGWNVWKVFPVWSKQCPKAVERAETFSLGRSMWMLLRQPDMEAFDDVMSTLDIVEDWGSCDDIPLSWKRTVGRCLKRDPNERINLNELLAFWDEVRLQLVSDSADQIDICVPSATSGAATE